MLGILCQKAKAARSVLLILLLFSSPIMATTYYVDNSRPDDSGNGQTPASAWRTVSKVNSSMRSIAGGDTILFRRGSEWREQLTIDKGGTPDKPLTFGAFGEGPLPVLNGSDLITGWTNYRGQVWQKLYNWTDPGTPSIASPQVMFFNGARGLLKASMAGLASPGDWYYDQREHILYVYSTANPDTVWSRVELGTRNYCVYGPYGHNNDYVVVQDLELKQSTHKGIRVGHMQDYWVVQRLVVHHNGPYYHLDPNFLDKQGISLQPTTVGNIIRDCVVYESGGNCIDVVGAQGAIIEHNKIYNFEHHGVDLKGGANATGNIVRYNVVYNTPEWSEYGTGGTNGIVVGVDPGGSVKIIAQCGIHDNLIYGVKGNGLLVARYANQIECSNNTICNCLRGVYTLPENTGTLVFENNLLYLNNVDGKRESILIGNPTNKILDYNCIWTPNKIAKINEADYANWNAYQGAGFDGHGINSDPMFVDYAAKNFRLKPGSPCIKRGTKVNLSADAHGQRVSDESTPDIGAAQK